MTSLPGCCDADPYFAWVVDEPSNGISTIWPMPVGCHQQQQAKLSMPVPTASYHQQQTTLSTSVPIASPMKGDFNSTVKPASPTEPTYSPPNLTGTTAGSEPKVKSPPNRMSEKMKNILIRQGSENPELTILPSNRQSALVRLAGQLEPGDIPSSVPVRFNAIPGYGSQPVTQVVSHPAAAPPATPGALIKASSPPPMTASLPPIPESVSDCTSHCTIKIKLDNPSAGLVVLQKVSQPTQFSSPPFAVPTASYHHQQQTTLSTSVPIASPMKGDFNSTVGPASPTEPTYSPPNLTGTTAGSEPKVTVKSPPNRMSEKMKNILIRQGSENPELTILPSNRQSALVRLAGQLEPGDIPSSVPVRFNAIPGYGSQPVTQVVSHPAAAPPATPGALIKASSPPPMTASLPPIPESVSDCTSHCTIKIKLDNPSAGIVVLQKVSQPAQFSSPPFAGHRSDVVGMLPFSHPPGVKVTVVNPVPVGMVQQRCSKADS